MRSNCLVLFVLGSPGAFGRAPPTDQTDAPVDYGTFESPSNYVRPRFVYWLNDASMDPARVVGDVKDGIALGTGGIKLLPHYGYGGSVDGMPPGANWSTYNFGTPAFNMIFRDLLVAHAEGGWTFDFTLGPNQGQGVPANPGDEGLQWDLVCLSSSSLIRMAVLLTRLY